MKKKKRIPRWLVILLIIVISIILFGLFFEEDFIDKEDGNNTKIRTKVGPNLENILSNG